MCCCGQPIINGQPGYKWQPNDMPSIRPVDPPALDEYDVLLYDEPGRCGGIDAHCHHYRMVKMFSSRYLLVQHGGGRERIPLHLPASTMQILDSVDTHARYWLLHSLYYAHQDGVAKGSAETRQYWNNAAIEKRIKLRKRRGSVSVYIQPELVHSAGYHPVEVVT